MDFARFRVSSMFKPGTLQSKVFFEEWKVARLALNHEL